MSYILHLETSTKNCSVTISKAGKLLVSCQEVAQDFKQAEKLYRFVEWAIQGVGIAFSDISAVAIGAGPGSYTGLRIGMSAAKGYCFALGVPLLSFSSLQVMANAFIDSGYERIVAQMDARRMEVYSGIFCGETGVALSKEEALVLDEKSYAEISGKKILFVGDGALKAKDILQLPNAYFMPDVYPSADFSVGITYQKFLQKEFEDLEAFAPNYLKESMANKMKR